MSWTIIILIFIQVLSNLCLILFELINALKKKIEDCSGHNKKMAKGISSDKYEIGEVVMSGIGKSVTEIELKQLRLSTPGDDERNFKGEKGQGLTRSIKEFKEEHKKGKGDSGEFFQIDKSD